MKVLTSLKQSSDEEREEWKKLSESLKVKSTNFFSEAVSCSDAYMSLRGRINSIRNKECNKT